MYMHIHKHAYMYMHRYVVDSGLRRASVYDPAVGMTALVTRPVSAAAAEQRAGIQYTV